LNILLFLTFHIPQAAKMIISIEKGSLNLFLMS
jgi:hypothetical protein